jgi:lipoprotein-anchoring transpeptidase ErfK/SrfK
VYVVRRGDSLGAIAVRYGTSVAALARANRIANPSIIYVGQRLVIPGRGAAAGSSSGGAAPAVTPGSSGRWIDVNVRTQRVTAFEGNRAVYSVPASTGIARYPTVLGRFRVYVKLRSTRMTGPGYDLPNVPYTMYYYKGYAVHGAYWHNNFGHPMSHGCVNLRPSDAQWFFNFASVGTPVVVHR